MTDLEYIRSKYDEYDKGDYCYAYDYTPLYERIGEVLVCESSGDYQGEDFVVLRLEDGTFGTLVNGWGSCSLCDALQSCGSLEDIVKLLDELRRSVVKHDNKQSVLDYVDQRDEFNSWYYSDFDWEKVKAEIGSKLR